MPSRALLRIEGLVLKPKRRPCGPYTPNGVGVGDGLALKLVCFMLSVSDDKFRWRARGGAFQGQP